MGADGEVRHHATTYFRCSMAGVPALLLVLAGTGYLRGLQDTRTPLVVAGLSAVVNLLLEVVFVLVLDWGMAGSAWSTVLVQWGAAAVYLAVVVGDVRRTGVPVRPDARRLGVLTRVGVDLLARTAALRVALLAATAVATRIGTDDVAAHQVAFEIWTFLALVLDAVAIAAQALVGRLLGAGDAAGAREASRRMLGWGAGTGAVSLLFVLALRPALPELFTDDAAVAALVSFLLVFVAVLQPVNGLVFALDGVLIGAGDLRYLAWAMAVAAGVFVPLAGAVLALGFGIGWLWAAIAVLQLARLATLHVRWRSDRWMVLGAA
jgi:putative MATE family efflux protein